MIESIDLNPYQLIGIIIAIFSVIIIPFVIFLYKLKSGQEQTTICIQRLEKEIIEHGTTNKEVAMDFKHQLESVKQDISMDLHVQVTLLKERSMRSEDMHKELKESLKEQKDFFVDWIQRVEDLLRDERFVTNTSSSNKRRKAITTTEGR